MFVCTETEDSDNKYSSVYDTVEDFFFLKANFISKPEGLNIGFNFLKYTSLSSNTLSRWCRWFETV